MRVLDTFRCDELANETEGFSGADLAAICREAGLIAIRRGLGKGIPADSLVMTRDDIYAALDEISLKRSPGDS